MKVRIFAALFALCILLAGCELGLPKVTEPAPTAAAPQLSSYEVVSTALEKTNTLDSMNMEMQMDISLSMLGQTMKMPMTVICKAKDMGSNTPIIQTYISTSVLGQESTIDMYQEGNWAYITTQGQNFKVDVTDGNPYDQISSSQDIMMELPEELLKNLPMTQNPDGTQTITITIPSDTFESIYGNMLDNINSTSGTGAATSMNIPDATVKIVVDQGYIVEYSMNFEMDLVVTGIETSSYVTASVKFIDPGKDVVIAPPEGYQDFPVIN